jgi:hypothetical protein
MRHAMWKAGRQWRVCRQIGVDTGESLPGGEEIWEARPYRDRSSCGGCDETENLKRPVGESATEPVRSSGISDRDRGSAALKVPYFRLYPWIPV